MSAPLYLNVDEKSCPDKGNKGLWFDRFFDQYDDNWKILVPPKQGDKQGKSDWLEKHFDGEKVGNQEQLNSYTLQQKALVESLQGNSYIFKANWHFVTGMGNTHPVENGFAWHSTLGVPYLSGAAVKGIVRSYIENYLDDDSEDNKRQLLLNWFGSTSKDPDETGYTSETGNLIFFDAMPIEPVMLVVDIMTPHMGDWYQNGAEKPNEPTTVPADWHDPVPITFLACKKIILQFSVALRQYPTDKEYHPEAIDLEDVHEVLTRALEQFGAGGKTATGYGSFIDLDNQLKEKEEKEKQKKLEAQETWENANIKKINARGLFLEATLDKKTARISWDEIKEQIEKMNLSNAQNKKLKKQGINKTIKVEKLGNSYKITNVYFPDEC